MNQLGQDAFWRVAKEAFANDSLELTLLPTEQCNLRCVYCYEKFERGRMSPATVEAVKALLRRRGPELRRLSIDWFGGEPLLASDIMEDIGASAMQLCARNEGLTYRSSVTTNGVLLTVDLARRLDEVGIRSYHVSLDGPRSMHDQTRKARGGQGTYDRIVRNLLNLRDSDANVRVELRVHITSENFEYLDDFADELAASYLHDDRFSIYFFPIADLGGPNGGRFSTVDNRVGAQAVRRLNERVRRPSGRHASTEDAPYVCYAAKANAWVIRSDARLAKCTVALDDSRNDVGRLLADGTMRIDDSRLRAWMLGWTNGDREALYCPLDSVVAGLERQAVTSS